MSNASRRKKFNKKTNNILGFFSGIMSKSEPEKISDIKNKLLFSGWIAGLLLLVCLVWILTYGPQTRNLMRTVNSVFQSNNDSRRLSGLMQTKVSASGLLGYWYLMYGTTDKMFVFTIFNDGILLPVGAVVSTEKVKEIIPLSAHAVQVFNDMPESVLRLYINRVEDAAVSSGIITEPRRGSPRGERR
ncbi:MAG: hypothetical protein FWC21_06805 [Treponema sp.]|nr:hypothetical protein [Treponema sp.]